MESRNGEKFAEPRSWALKWAFAQEAARSKKKPEYSGVDKFAEPQGWALKWDGFALSEVQERQNGHAPSPTTKSR